MAENRTRCWEIVVFYGLAYFAQPVHKILQIRCDIMSVRWGLENFFEALSDFNPKKNKFSVHKKQVSQFNEMFEYLTLNRKKLEENEQKGVDV